MNAHIVTATIACLLITGCATTEPTDQAEPEQTAQIECKPIPRGGLCDNATAPVSGCPPQRTTCDAKDDGTSYNDGGRSSVGEIVRGMGTTPGN